jgi:CheY-like chemotaxis protein
MNLHQLVTRVAVVDDDEGVQAALRTYFDLSRDFRIVGSFLSAGEALERIPQIQVDVVLMDIVMPRISGIECTRRLKLLLPDLPIVMLTALDDFQSERNGGWWSGDGKIWKVDCHANQQDPHWDVQDPDGDSYRKIYPPGFGAQ